MIAGEDEYESGKTHEKNTINDPLLDPKKTWSKEQYTGLLLIITLLFILFIICCIVYFTKYYK